MPHACADHPRRHMRIDVAPSRLLRRESSRALENRGLELSGSTARWIISRRPSIAPQPPQHRSESGRAAPRLPAPETFIELQSCRDPPDAGGKYTVELAKNPLRVDVGVDTITLEIRFGEVLAVKLVIRIDLHHSLDRVAEAREVVAIDEAASIEIPPDERVPPVDWDAPHQHGV